MLASQYFPDLVFFTGINANSDDYCQWKTYVAIIPSYILHPNQGGNEVTAHRFVVAAGAPNLAQMLEPDDLVLARRNSETSTVRENHFL